MRIPCGSLASPRGSVGLGYLVRDGTGFQGEHLTFLR